MKPQTDSSMRPHKRLKLWEKLMVVVEDIYCATEAFPKQEIYGLSLQMRRAAVSIARKGKQEKIQFYSIAKGSLSELDAQLEIAVS